MMWRMQPRGMENMKTEEKILQALHTGKGPSESWRQVFDRISRIGGVDNKVIIEVLVCILEDLYEEKRTVNA